MAALVHKDNNNLDQLKNAVRLLDSEDNGFCLLKIKNCSAEESVPFTKAFCAFTRNVDTLDNKTTFQFVSLFERGFQTVASYVNDPEYVPKRKGERLALERLLDFINTFDDCQQALSAEPDTPHDVCWTVQLAHHLLARLGANPNYTLNKCKKTDRRTCPCCQETINGLYADTSMGAVAGWHGYMDVLLGNGSLPATIAVQDNSDSPDSDETQIHDDLPSFRDQIIAQTIVFSFVQRKDHPDFEHFLTPNIAISRETVVIYFYDCENDILLESSAFPLFWKDGLSLCTVLAVWLAVNYKYLCSGTPTCMIDEGFTADFLKHNKLAYKTYEEDVRQGCGLAKTKASFFIPKLYHDMSYSRGSYTTQQGGSA